MWDQDLDFELIDDSSDQWENLENENQEEQIDTSDDKSKKSDEQNTGSTKSNKSNWKKINKLNKALLAENARLKDEAKKAKSKPVTPDEFDDLDDDEPIFDKTEFRFFIIENPDAKDYKNDIENIMTYNPTLSLEDAFALAKAKKPKQSQSSDDFNTKSVNTKVRKRLEDLTEEEALKLDGTKYLQYMRAKWKIK